MKKAQRKIYNPARAYEAVKQWCKKRHIKVLELECFSAEYHFKTEDETAKICIPVDCSLNIKLFSILHECGHHLVGDRRPDQRYGQGYSMSNNKDRVRTLRYRVEVLDEELEAWSRGLKLAARLGIYVNIENYKRFRDNCIKKYAIKTRNPRKKAKPGILPVEYTKIKEIKHKALVSIDVIQR